MNVAFKEEATFKDGCLNLRKSVLDKILQVQSPGPIYNASSQGVASNEKSLRNITFGSGSRFNDGNGNSKRRIPQSSQCPGPQTYDPAAIRRAISLQSNHTNATGITFGSSKRDSSRTQTQPSPAEYSPENIRKAIMLTKSKMPSIRFGDPPKNARKKRSKANNSPSPAEYDTEALRKGVFSLSSKRRPVGIKFSTGPRTYNDMEERERKRTPGPQSYIVPSALGNQVNSRYRSQPSVSFGAR